MAVNYPSNGSNPILDLTLPASTGSKEIVLVNSTLGKSLTISLDDPWDGTDLYIDFANRVLGDENNQDRSELISGDLFETTDPLMVGDNDVTIQVNTTSATSSGPNSPGTLADVDLFGAPAWSNPSNAASSNDSYATVAGLQKGNFTDLLQATNFGFSIPSDATIAGILAEVERSAGSGSRVGDFVVRIVKGGTVGSADRAHTGTWPETDAYASYGGSSDGWGESWTPADINASGFGVAIAATSMGSIGGGLFAAAQIDHIRLTVHYVEPGTPAAYGGSAAWRWTERSF